MAPSVKLTSEAEPFAEVARRMEKMRHDNGDPAEWDVHHWQEINPVHTEALLQLTFGSNCHLGFVSNGVPSLLCWWLDQYF